MVLSFDLKLLRIVEVILPVKQRFIALDQFVHTLFDSYAMADETFSARCYREHLDHPEEKKWIRYMKFINALFRDPNHCKDSYESELKRSQYPDHYKGK